ncbi:hypothetical protein AVEN_51555-1 [Araneus ventricosus]|nr:hypothetical protein AVEN_96320-1 [Araneus ventricosus]GBO26653.1 hypothetical protein AVEN_51555-1 [Araneus ventricosus]
MSQIFMSVVKRTNKMSRVGCIAIHMGFRIVKVKVCRNSWYGAGIGVMGLLAIATVIVCRLGRQTPETYPVTEASYDTICTNKINISQCFHHLYGPL